MKYYLKVLKYMSPYKYIVFFTWIISILVLCLQGLSIWVGAGFIEKLVSGKSPSILNEGATILVRILDYITVTILQQETPYKSLLAGTVVLFISGFFTPLLRVLKLFILGNINQTVLIKIRSDMFDNLTYMDLSFSKKYRPGEIVSLFTKDVDQLNVALLDASDRIFMQPIRLVLALGLMFSLSMELTLWVILFLLAGSFVVYLSGDKIEKIWKIFLEKTAYAQGYLTEYLSAVIVSRALGNEHIERNRFVEISNNLKNVQIRKMVYNSMVPQIVGLTSILSACLLLIIGGHKVFILHTLDGNILIKMAFLLPMALYPMRALASFYASYKASVASAKRVFQLMDEPKPEFDSPDAVDAKPFKEKIVIKNLDYSIDHIKILENIFLEIPRDTITVIYGPSGSGKTTLLSLIAKFTRATGGAIFIDDVNLNKIKNNSWRKMLGIVMQEPVLLNGTIRENLLYASPEASERMLIKVLEQVLLWEDGCAFPNELETIVGNRGEMLSGGERQRLTIARALMNNPDILLLDEPTSMLDLINKKKIRDTILSISENRTIVIATHDPVLMEIADSSINISDGRIIEKK